MKGTVSIRQLHERYQNDVQFLSIYTREAHPTDGWWLGRRLTRGIIKKLFPQVSMRHYDPKTVEERREVAGECQTALQYGVRTYVDEMDDAVNRAYAAWPTRLYLVGLDGRVAYAGGMGPFGFKPRDLGAAIKTYLKSI